MRLCTILLVLLTLSHALTQTRDHTFLKNFLSDDAQVYVGILLPYGFVASLPANSELVLSARAEIAGSSVFVRVSNVTKALEFYSHQLEVEGWERVQYQGEELAYCKPGRGGLLVEGLERKTEVYLLLRDDPYGVGQFCFYYFEK